MEPETCGECMGAGAWHDCGEDTCCCIDPEPNQYCGLCLGEGLIYAADDPLPWSGGYE